MSVVPFEIGNFRAMTTSMRPQPAGRPTRRCERTTSELDRSSGEGLGRNIGAQGSLCIDRVVVLNRGYGVRVAINSRFTLNIL
jgi:hypothetical protein